MMIRFNQCGSGLDPLKGISLLSLNPWNGKQVIYCCA